MVQHVVSLFLLNLHLEFKLLLTSSQLSEEWDLFLSFLFLPTCPVVYLFRVLTAFVSGQLCTDGLATLASAHCFFVSSSSPWLSPCRLHWSSPVSLLYCTFHLRIPLGSRVNTVLSTALVSYDTIMWGPHFRLK